MTPRRKLTAFRIDDDLEQGLQQVWERDGVAVSEQIRRAIRAWLVTKRVLKQASPRAATARKARKGAK